MGVKKKSNRSSYGLLLKRPCLKRVLVNGGKDSGDSMDSADLTNSSDLSDSVDSLFSSVSIHSFLKGYTNFSIQSGFKYLASNLWCSYSKRALANPINVGGGLNALPPISFYISSKSLVQSS